MASQTITAAGKSYSIQLRGKRVTINVKCRATPRVPAGYRQKMEYLENLDPGTKERFQEWAWDSVTTIWWERAQTTSQAYGLGKVSAEGRSGGWLVLDDITQNTLDTYVREVEDACVGCGLPYKEHQKGKCLFDAAEFQTKQRSSEEKLEALVRFSEEVQESVKTDRIQHELDAAVAYYINEAR
jgi:hypothetical protein